MEFSAVFISVFNVGLGDMAPQKKSLFFLLLFFFDIDYYHDKCQIIISFKFKDRFLLQCECCQTHMVNFVF